MRAWDDAGMSRPVPAAAIVFAIVLLASLFGILARPTGMLAAFWPANAILIGLFVRYPRLASPTGWAAAAAGYLAADLVTDHGPVLALGLAFADLAEVALAVFLFSRLSKEDRRLRRPLSVLYMFAIVLAVALLGGVLGGAGLASFFDQGWQVGARRWFVTALVNATLILPVMLTLPNFPWWDGRFATGLRGPADLLRVLAPVAAVAVSVAAAIAVGGPGAIAIPGPALIWCALSYNLFGTALVLFVFSSWKIVELSLTALPSAGFGPAMSMQIGITLLALGPLTVASVNKARNDLLRRLDRAASHDFLTDALSRSAFMMRGEATVAQLVLHRRPFAVLMLDIDHFKQVNDTYGHAAGDAVLVAFSNGVRNSLRADDLLGRVGGEEFAVLLLSVPPEAACEVAEKIRAAINGLDIALPDGRRMSITVSIGLVVHDGVDLPSLGDLLACADAALYEAKETGRNRVCVAAGGVR